MGSWIALGLLILAGIVLIVNHDAGTIAGLDPSHFAGVLASLALLIYLGGSLLYHYRNAFTQAIKHMVLWAGFALILIGLYAYRFEIESVAYRIAGELLPAGTTIAVSTTENGDKSVQLRKRYDGHFIARSKVNGRSVDFIIDTGASTVVLNENDARRIGVDIRSLRYNIPVQTANGTSFAARVRLNSISIGNIVRNNVDALIARPGVLHQSLLGMNFLNRLRSYEFQGDYLTLRS